MKKEDNIDVQTAKDLANIVNTQNKSIENINRNIYGTDDFENIKDITANVSKLVNEYNKGGTENIISQFNKISKNLNTQEKNKLSLIKDSLVNTKNMASISNVFNGMDKTISRYEDLLLVTKMMPRLAKAKRVLVTSIMSPDDFTKQLSLNINVNGKSVSTENPSLYSKIQTTLKKYKYTQEIKHIISGAVTFGKYYEAIIPYEKLYNDLLKNKESKTEFKSGNNKLRESTDIILNESTKKIINDTFENTKEIYDGINNIINNVVINESSTGLFKGLNFESIAKKAEKAYSKGISTASEGLIKSNKQKNIHLGLSGCKVKRLDPRRLVKIAIGDTVFGYWYIETNTSIEVVRNPGIFRFKSNLNSQTKEEGVETIYRSISELLYRKMDKKMIKHNADIKENLYEVLKYADVTNNQINMTFIEPEYVQEFQVKEGESVFSDSLFYGKMWVMTFLTNLSAKVARSNDIRAYYVTTDPQGKVDSMVMNAINTLKKNNRSFYSMTNLGKMISAFNKFDDLVIPKDSDDKHPIEFDIVQGQDVDMDLDTLEMIEKIATDPVVPLALIESSANEDFAKAYAVLHLDFMRSVLDLQIDLNQDNEDYIKKILKYDNINFLSEDEISIIDSLEISFQSPKVLLLTNTVDQVNNAKDLAQAISDLVMGSEAKQSNIDAFMLEICKMYAPNVPWEKFEEIKKNILINDVKYTFDETDDSEE